MKFLFNFISLLVLIAYCLYIDGAKINHDAHVKAALDKVDKVMTLNKIRQKFTDL